MANNPVQGYPDTFGKHGVTLVEHSGPALYVQLTATAGGDQLTANSYGGSNVVGLRGYSYVSGGLTYSGNYRVDPIYSNTSTPTAGIRSLIRLKWTYANAATGTVGNEVTASTVLSGETVRLLIAGA